eukprot:GHVN01005116.1.p1 GENE.GHVN01005116.1~~GHVN01005116.1.p1  ORF type:complete len:454 (+),score=67.15 GHVN01005116.1:86-1447(+)
MAGGRLVTDEATIGVGINGLGRIGRLVFRLVMSRTDMTLKHINARGDTEHLAYLIRYDTAHGRFNGTVEAVNGSLVLNGNQTVTVSHCSDPTEIPWAENGVQFVCESTGAFCTTQACLAHVKRPGGAKKVIISAPAKDIDTPVLVVGVNANEDYDPETMDVVSNASCTTNGLAPIVKVIDDIFGIDEALMTTIHSITRSQPVLDDCSAQDWRGGRSSIANIIPSSTGAAKAVARCLPNLQGKISGMSFRVPTIDVSVVDLTVRTMKATNADEIQKAIKTASLTYMAGIISVSRDPCVSGDFLGQYASAVLDGVMGCEGSQHMFKVTSFYDNEWGYSARLVDLIRLMAHKGGMLGGMTSPIQKLLPAVNLKDGSLVAYPSPRLLPQPNPREVLEAIKTNKSATFSRKQWGLYWAGHIETLKAIGLQPLAMPNEDECDDVTESHGVGVELVELEI